MVLKEQVTDVRSDDEEEEDEEIKKGLERVEGGKEGDGSGVDKMGGMNGHATQRRADISNGSSLHASAGVEGRKRR